MHLFPSRRVCVALIGAVAAAAAGLSVDGRAQGARAASWAKAREVISKYRSILDNSGLVEVDAQLSPAVDAENLQALCAARKDAVRRARTGAEGALRELGEWRDPITDERRAALFRHLAAVASFSGDMKEALRHFEAARAALEPHLEEYPALKERFFALDEAIAATLLRQGEIDNCLMHPNADRCLFPVRAGGRHEQADAARAATAHLRSYLSFQPDDVGARWLLNLAHMIVGDYPDAVPPAHVMRPDLFRSDVKMPRFIDVAARAGLGQQEVAGGTIADDFDGDGWIDVVFSSVDYCSPLRFYRNRGDGTFEDRTEAAGLLGQLGGINAVQTDYNNDGRPDIFIMRGGWEVAMRNSLLRNNGDGTFTDVTRAAGLSSGAHATHSVAWVDFDNDGWVDVFVGHELTPSQLFRNRRDGTFEDVTAHAGVGATAFTKGVAAGDYDGDGFADLYVSNMYGANFLYRNRADGTFVDVAVSLGVDKPLASFPTWFFDYDNDGRLDIFVASYPNSLEEFAKHYVKLPPSAEVLTLYRNAGGGKFVDVSRDVSLNRVVPSMGANFGDLDNDGFLDMYLGTGTPSFAALMPNIMLKNDAGRTFVDVTDATGTGHLQKGHGVAFADVDNDGDEDVVLNVGGAVPGDRYHDALYENPGAPGTHWINLRLVGVKTNRSAIGAKITVRLKGRTIYREVTSGGSFGASPLTQHIGLGPASRIEKLEIAWPASRTTQSFTDVPVDRSIEIKEFEGRYVERHPSRDRAIR